MISSPGPASANWRDFFEAVSFGLMPGYSRVTALGNNPATVAGEDIWPGSNAYPFLAAAAAMEILSASANDTSAAGTGARTVLVTGLDASYNQVTQVVALNGVTPVALATPLLRVNQLVVATAGSGQTNAGDITLRDVAAATARGIIPATYGISRQCIYTVPAGFTLSIISQVFSVNRTGNGVATYASRFVTPAGVARMPLELSVGSGTPYRHDGDPGITLAEKTDFTVRCNFVSAATLDLTAGFLGVLRQNDTVLFKAG